MVLHVFLWDSPSQALRASSPPHGGEPSTEQDKPCLAPMRGRGAQGNFAFGKVGSAKGRTTDVTIRRIGTRHRGAERGHPIPQVSVKSLFFPPICRGGDADLSPCVHTEYMNGIYNDSIGGSPLLLTYTYSNPTVPRLVAVTRDAEEDRGSSRCCRKQAGTDDFWGLSWAYPPVIHARYFAVFLPHPFCFDIDI